MSEDSTFRSGVKHAVENLAETLKEGTAASVGKEAHLHTGQEKHARDVMTTNVTCAKSTDTVASVAKQLAGLNIGAMPICGVDNRLHGMVTDRDIVTKVVAAGGDPAVIPVAAIASEPTITVSPDCTIGELLQTMSKHQIRRVPVIEDHRLVGIVSQADVALALDHDRVGGLVEAVSHP